ncbi:MAG: ATP-binding cassette domain-containing protein [Candidatus Bipolaricaulaceae bacterium]
MLAIQVSELRFVTEEGVGVFDGLSLSVPREGFVWVVGPPGSGKTLLLRILLREVRPQGGQILLLGRNIRRISAKSFRAVRRRVGYLPEAPPLLRERTVLGHLLFKLRALGLRGEEAQDALHRALDLAELKEVAERKATELSPLEQKRLGLALALFPNAALLLCDDPLRGLDPRDQEKLLGTLERIHRGGVTLLGTAREEAPLRAAGFAPGGAKRALIYLREPVRP